MMARSKPVVLSSRRGAVAIITLNRPEARNAIDVAMALALDGALRVAESDEATRATVVTGHGPAFCAGADLKALAAGEPDAFVEDRGWAGVTNREGQKPLIAAVEGPALAGGCELVLACDLAIAAADATFGLPEVKHGLIAAAGGAARLPHQMPAKAAMELLLTGDPISAERALALGLVNAVVPRGGALDAAVDLASRIALNPPLAVSATRMITNQAAEHGVAAGIDLSSRLLTEVMKSADVAEGLKAFGEDRPPRWQN